MWILALINVSGIVSRFWVRVHEIRVHEIKAYKINHLLSFIIVPIIFSFQAFTGKHYFW